MIWAIWETLSCSKTPCQISRPRYRIATRIKVSGIVRSSRTVMEEINRLEKTSFEQPKYVEYREYAPTLALVALALLLLGFTAETTWKLRLP